MTPSLRLQHWFVDGIVDSPIQQRVLMAPQRTHWDFGFGRWGGLSLYHGVCWDEALSGAQ